ncbi:Bug family tripartite tricarboxylate transporter substrate binding protein [Rhodoplanes sp. Z2-YC6860]|uniref:Bug family tripartite tricarboxylate transporter substrate binding protein n=1 Tax=Rhodoplanes sp. Z2-YC6860 TaxID=674703 RepID=UPI00078EE54B|nr:tripartite tricarboxylate transporter substrate-binding protein [Rhodoplanes sp. Z2-YC6860]AMN41904.1 extra-cytoplasmic solute receptor [Rhodoplanes sp. Z2-YC6860]
MRSAVCLLAGVLSLSTLPAAPTQAQTYPSRNIRVVVPFPAGGVTDIGARFVSQKLAEALGQPAVIENRPGASGTLGVDAVTKATPDGYTILITTGDFITVPSLMPAAPYDPYKDLIPVTRIATAPLLLLTHPKSGLNSPQEVIAKAKAAPGEVTFSTPGAGTINQLAAEWFALEAGIKLLHVPYRGGAGLANGLAAGDTALGVTTLTSVKGLVDDGKIKVLAQLTRERAAFLAQWPTMTDVGLNVDAGLTLSLYVPTGTPQAIVTRLDDETRKILKDEALRKKFNDLGMEITPISQAAFAERIRQEAARYKTVVEQTGVKLN